MVRLGQRAGARHGGPHAMAPRPRRGLFSGRNHHFQPHSQGGTRTTRTSCGAVMGESEQKELKRGIATFYDESSTLWEEIWGEHMHHGYYDETAKLTIEGHRQAQVEMIDKVLEWAGVSLESLRPEQARVVDVGCGVGGSTRHIVSKFAMSYGCGITLSPYQARRAGEITSQDAGIPPESVVEFKVEDALNQPFEDDSFDLVWSLESGEHMPDKERFVKELARVCKPGGRIILVTWCHRVLEEGETDLSAYERVLLNLINRAYFLPRWVSVQDYVELCEAEGLRGVRTDDWSARVAPFWTAVLKTAATWRGLRGLLRSGAKTARGAAVMPLMRLGFASGTIKFNLLTCTKPEK